MVLFFVHSHYFRFGLVAAAVGKGNTKEERKTSDYFDCCDNVLLIMRFNFFIFMLSMQWYCLDSVLVIGWV